MMEDLVEATNSPHDGWLSIAMISPDRQRRLSAISTFARCGNVQTREFEDYPHSLEVVPHLLNSGFDAILIDVDGNPDFALALVEKLCIARSTIVMVFSAHAHAEIMLRSLRAGAREFFTLPFKIDAVIKSLQWVVNHPKRLVAERKADGRLLVFFGSKGGVGVTTIAANFAVALAEQSRQSTLLIDLNLHLGDAAHNIGVRSNYSVVDALENSASLEPQLLSKFLVKHSSGLTVLAAPAQIPSMHATMVAIGCLVAVARQQFDNVVIDAGKKIDLKQMHLFEHPSSAYLITQVGIPELRNANRLIAQFSAESSPHLEIVINRHQSRFLGLTDEHLNKALTRPVTWKVPNDYQAVRKMQDTSTPLVDRDSQLATVIRQMARCVTGQSDEANASGIKGKKNKEKAQHESSPVPTLTFQ